MDVLTAAVQTRIGEEGDVRVERGESLEEIVLGAREELVSGGRERIPVIVRSFIFERGVVDGPMGGVVGWELGGDGGGLG